MTAARHSINHSAIPSAESREPRVTIGEPVQLAAAVQTGPW
ncbi:MAG TPA: hypothetical protein VGH77_20025 [Streptosporangiaceae bacterium]|jgi:hypothetical protein